MPGPSGRRRELTRAGIEVIADGGMRALTHRAVEAVAGLPSGTASYHFASRKDLVRAVLTEIAAISRASLEQDQVRPGVGPHARPARTRAERLVVSDQIAAGCAIFIARQLTHNRRSTLARYALAVEVATDAELTEVLHAGDQFAELAAEACAQLGVSDPGAAGRHLVALIEGITHEHLVGATSLRAESPEQVAEAAAAAIRAYLLGLALG